MNIEKLVRDSKVIAVVCNQWGDTGKGKIVDYLSENVDVIARGTGGNNAGHTVILNGREKIFHLLPTGILKDSQGKKTILGNGMVIDLQALCTEIDELDHEKLSYNNLMISKDASLIMPYHIEMDKAKNQSQKDGGIGSTGRGIGPCYTDKIARRGIFMEDLFNKDKLTKKILRDSEFYSRQKINVEEIIDELDPYISRIKPFVRDTVSEMHKSLRQGKKILLEGAQGLLLSVEHGTYPYVTSSDCSLNGTCSGVGISARVVDLPLGVFKFPFMTRVGAGPFPTELGGRSSEEYCAAGTEHDILFELEKYGVSFTKENGCIKYNHHDPKIIELMNSNDSFTQGVGIRLAAKEYGATTGRPRRTGWTDLISARYAININGPLMVLTKPDSISGIEKFKLGHNYKNGDSIVEDFSKDGEFLKKVIPTFITYKGYRDISSVRKYDELPSSLQTAIRDFENFTGGETVAISVGAEKDAIIFK